MVFEVGERVVSWVEWITLRVTEDEVLAIQGAICGDRQNIKWCFACEGRSHVQILSSTPTQDVIKS